MIDSELLEAYVAELEALRSHGSELAKRFPDIAGRLDIGPRRSRDPQVERVVESAAFLAARMRLMLEDNAAELPAMLLSMLAPTLIEPVPSMALIELRAGTEAQAVPRGTRFDLPLQGSTLACFSTTMETTAAPITLRLRRLESTAGYRDGIAVQFRGDPPRRVLLCLGNDEMRGATLLDALSESLAAVEVLEPGARHPVTVPRTHVRLTGFDSAEAALPVRPAAHSAHRLVTEFLVFPEKFRFVLLDGLPLRSESEVRFRLSRPLPFAGLLPQDMMAVNRVPVVNLWPTSATPIDVSGRVLKYPVRADGLRYRSVECHSVESVDLYEPSGGKPIRLDPMVGFGEVRGTTIRWGVDRRASSVGGEVSLFFQGLDYERLGRQRYLAAARILASNRDVPQYARTGARLQSTSGLGSWHGALVTVPTRYRPPLVAHQSMEALIGYLRSSLASLAESRRQRNLRDYLRRFPGGREASWIDGIERIDFRSVAALRDGHPQPGMAGIVSISSERSPGTSKAVIKRVLEELFNSQRGLNRVEEVFVRST